MLTNKKKWILRIMVAVLIVFIIIFASTIVKSKLGNSKENTTEYLDGINEGAEGTDEKENAAGTGEMILPDGSELETEDLVENATETGEGKQGSDVAENKGNVGSTGNIGNTGNKGAAIYAGGLHVEGTKLVDASGNIVQLKGLSTHGIGWYPQYVNADFFRQLKEEFGINVIRLAMYTAENNGYCTGGDQSQLTSILEDGVSYATQNSMYAIIDWHILSDNNPNMHVDEAKKFFAQMSKKYAGNENVLYEICNEPNGGTSWEEIRKYAMEVIPVIRSNAPNAIIIVGTPTWCQEVDKAAANPITGYDNVMYAFHFYAATHKEDLRNRMVSAIQKGLPIFVTEFGICDASGAGAIDETQAAEWIRTMNSYEVSYIMWNISNKAETSAIISSSCNKKSGFTQNDLSPSGKWFLQMMNGNIAMQAQEKLVNESANQNGNSNNDTTGNNISENNIAGSVPSTPSVSASSIQAQAKAQLVNSWENNGQKFEQYNMNIKNDTQSDCASWTASVDLQKNFQISQGWCANFEINGTVLKMTPVDYNSHIAAGQSVDNIGIIICYTE